MYIPSYAASESDACAYIPKVINNYCDFIVINIIIHYYSSGDLASSVDKVKIIKHILSLGQLKLIDSFSITL